MVYQTNSNYALTQFGPNGEVELILGGLTEEATAHPWKDFRWNYLNNPNYAGFFVDFISSGTTYTATAPLPLAAAGDSGFSLPKSDAIAGSIGVVAMTANASATDYVALAQAPQFTFANGWLFFTARVRIPALLGKIEVGISDAASETAGLAFSTHTVAGVTDVATDAAVFALEPAGSVTKWTVNYVNNGTPGAYESSTTAAINTWYNIDIAVNSDGDALFYLDGDLVTRVDSCLRNTIRFNPWITIVDTSGAGNILLVDYVGIAVDRA